MINVYHFVECNYRLNIFVYGICRCDIQVVFFTAMLMCIFCSDLPSNQLSLTAHKLEAATDQEIGVTLP